MSKVALATIFCLAPLLVHAQTLTWDPYTAPTDFAGFVVYIDGTEQAVIPPEGVAAGEWDASGLPWLDGPQELFVTARDLAGQESDPSNTVVYDPRPWAPGNLRIHISIEGTIQ